MMTPQQKADYKVKWMKTAVSIETDSSARQSVKDALKSLIADEDWVLKQNTSESDDTVYFKSQQELSKFIEFMLSK